MVNAPVTAKQPPSWWKEGVNLYQIYPSSYKDDRNGDGVGDLRGIINKLDYIKSLGVDGIWLCPHYKSPRVDEGYDISDYNDIHEPFGTMDDCLELIEAVHARGMKVLFDLVINHCSDQHDWFKESRSSKENPKRDWFIWRPPRMVDGVRHPPNNWRACFGGSVWEWDELTQEYYLHYFVPEQPDFNWENPEVRSALFDKAIKFWLDRGVDGFRIDTVNMYSKYLDFPDAKVVAPDTPWQPAGHYFSNGPRLREFLREMRKEAFSKYDCFTIGECPNTPSLDKILEYVSTDSEALDCTILFDLMDTDHGGTTKYPLMAKEWKLSEFKRLTAFAQQLADPEHKAHALSYLENHDQARSVSRFASDAPEHRLASSKLLSTYLLTLSGSIIIYQGQEIGMINAPKAWDIDEEYLDVNTINTWKELKADAEATNDPALLDRGRAGIQLTARDHARTPMQWDNTEHAGFSKDLAPGKKPWYRVMDSYAEGLNVAAQDGDAKSTLNFYRSMLRLRKQHADVLVTGRFKLHDPAGEETVVYTKAAHDGSRTALVALNFTADKQPFTVPAELEGKDSSLLLSTLAKDGANRELEAFEARIYLY